MRMERKRKPLFNQRFPTKEEIAQTDLRCSVSADTHPDPIPGDIRQNEEQSSNGDLPDASILKREKKSDGSEAAHPSKVQGDHGNTSINSEQDVDNFLQSLFRSSPGPTLALHDETTDQISPSIPRATPSNRLHTAPQTRSPHNTNPRQNMNSESVDYIDSYDAPVASRSDSSPPKRLNDSTIQALSDAVSVKARRHAKMELNARIEGARRALQRELDQRQAQGEEHGSEGEILAAISKRNVEENTRHVTVMAIINSRAGENDEDAALDREIQRLSGGAIPEHHFTTDR